MEKVSPDKVGERIRAVRGKQTQTEFANVLGVKKQNYISRYERGRIPSPDLLVRIAEVGRVTTDWLLTGERGGARGTALSQQSKTIKKVTGKTKPAGTAKARAVAASTSAAKVKAKVVVSTRSKAVKSAKQTSARPENKAID